MTFQPLATPPGPAGAWTASSPAQAAVPRSHPQLLRGPRHRWWRGVLAILMATFLGLFAVLVISLVAFGILLLGGDLQLSADPVQMMADMLDEPVIFLGNNLALASLIPVSVLSVWACFGWRPRWVSSVVPGLRWKWMLTVFALTLPLFAALTALSLLTTGLGEVRLDTRALTLVAIILLTTPLQAAGEEYLFRGLLTQSIGSWFARPWAAIVVSGLISALLFAALHGAGGIDQDLWLFLGRFLFGLLFSYLAWQTGGLEAPIAAHAANNMVIMVPLALTGGLGQTMVAGEGSALGIVTLTVVMVLQAVIVVALARRWGLRRVHDPARQPGGGAPGLG